MIAGLAAGSASLADALDFLADVANYAVSLLIVGMAWRYLLEGVAAGWARASIQSQSALVPRRPHRGRRQNHRRRKRHTPGVVAVGALVAVAMHDAQCGLVLRYPLSYRDIEELFLERGLEVDHSTLNRWGLAYAPLIERRLSYRRMLVTGGVRRQRLWASVLASSMDLSQPRLSYGVVHQPRWCRSCPRACAIGLSVLE